MQALASLLEELHLQHLLIMSAFTLQLWCHKVGLGGHCRQTKRTQWPIGQLYASIQPLSCRATSKGQHLQQAEDRQTQIRVSHVKPECQFRECCRIVLIVVYGRNIVVTWSCESCMACASAIENLDSVSGSQSVQCASTMDENCLIRFDQTL